MRKDNSGINFEQIRIVAAKDELTEEDIEQLTHFVNSSKTELDKTTYWGNTIVQPNAWEKRTYRWSDINKSWTELHSKAKSADSDK